jgi:hypothetical protein
MYSDFENEPSLQKTIWTLLCQDAVNSHLFSSTLCVSVFVSDHLTSNFSSFLGR